MFADVDFCLALNTVVKGSYCGSFIKDSRIEMCDEGHSFLGLVLDSFLDLVLGLILGLLLGSLLGFFLACFLVSFLPCFLA